MSDDTDRLIHGYLDGILSEAETDALGAWLAADPEHARHFAEAMLLHDRLADLHRARAALAEAEAPREAMARPGRRRRLALAALAAGVAAAVVVGLYGVSNPNAGAAEAQLDRLIAAAGHDVDRTYRIAVLLAGDAPEPPGPEPRLDGALLHVRGGGRYVLERPTGAGSLFVTGSDGREAWSIPPEGPVRVSPDPARFRGVVPGEQQDLPFLDLTATLSRLRAAYTLTLAPADPASGLRRMSARKRSPSYRGPREVQLVFEPATGSIRQLRLDGLPRARGGPRAVELDLIAERDLGPSFFEHRSHHGPGRTVVRDAR